MPTAAKKSTATKTNATDKKVVTMDRRRDERRDSAKATKSDKQSESSADQSEAEPRRKTQRRRHIDPTTCERDYSGKEVEFMKAMDEYKQSSGRMFPTCSEVLEVVRSLGYVQLTDEQYESLGLSDEVEEEADSFSEEETEELLEV